MAAVLLPLLLTRPGPLRSSLDPMRKAWADTRSPTSNSELPQRQHYGLRVSPYKAVTATTLGHVANGVNAADAEWQDFVLRLSVQLRRLRLDAGLSQEEVAHRAGLSRFIYRQYESGESRRGTAANPALRSILSIAQVLQVPVEELLPRPMPDLRSR